MALLFGIGSHVSWSQADCVAEEKLSHMLLLIERDVSTFGRLELQNRMLGFKYNSFC